MWGMIDLVPGEQHDAEVTAHVSLTGVAGSSLWREQSHYALIAKALKTLASQAISFQVTGALPPPRIAGERWRSPGLIEAG